MKYFEIQKDYKTLEEEHSKVKEILGQTNAKNEELRVKLAREIESRERESAKRDVSKMYESHVEKRMVGMDKMPSQVQPRANPMSPPTGAVPMTPQKKKEPITMQDLQAKQFIFEKK